MFFFIFGAKRFIWWGKQTLQIPEKQDMQSWLQKKMQNKVQTKLSAKSKVLENLTILQV